MITIIQPQQRFYYFVRWDKVHGSGWTIMSNESHLVSSHLVSCYIFVCFCSIKTKIKIKTRLSDERDHPDGRDILDLRDRLPAAVLPQALLQLDHPVRFHHGGESHGTTNFMRDDYQSTRAVPYSTVPYSRIMLQTMRAERERG